MDLLNSFLGQRMVAQFGEISYDDNYVSTDNGLFYIDLNEDMDLKILMTLTSAFCPVGDMLYNQVCEACNIPCIKNVDVEMTFDPQWTAEMIPMHAKLEMGLL